jgi:hypothetical protein
MCRKAVPRLIIENAICANVVPAWAANGYSSIEPRVGVPRNGSKALEAVVGRQIVHDKKRCFGVVIECQPRPVGSRQVDRVIANALLFGDDGVAPEQTVFAKFGLACV